MLKPKLSDTLLLAQISNLCLNSQDTNSIISLEKLYNPPVYPYVAASFYYSPISRSVVPLLYTFWGLKFSNKIAHGFLGISSFNNNHLAGISGFGIFTFLFYEISENFSYTTLMALSYVNYNDNYIANYEIATTASLFKKFPFYLSAGIGYKIKIKGEKEWPLFTPMFTGGLGINFPFFFPN